MAVPGSKPTNPPMKDLTTENITENTILINSQSPSPRLRFLLACLVNHLHSFARETRLSTEEWSHAIDFLTSVGQICSPVRQEFILLSDILGLSLLVDSISHPKPEGATEGSVLGPFHTHDPPVVEQGATLSHDEQGEPCLVKASIHALNTGEAISDVKIDVWETDSTGHYDVQYSDLEHPDGRGVLHSDAAGEFWFKCILPVSYPIPHDGPVGKLLQRLGRHPYRPAHLHFMFEKEGWDRLITALYIRGDPYETSDAVFGVKESLLVSPSPADRATAEKYGVEQGSAVLSYNFALMTNEEAKELQEQRSREALDKLGMKGKLVDGLPIEDVD